MTFRVHDNGEKECKCYGADINSIFPAGYENVLARKGNWTDRGKCKELQLTRRPCSTDVDVIAVCLVVIRSGLFPSQLSHRWLISIGDILSRPDSQMEGSLTVICDWNPWLRNTCTC
jgi:hypothetical protein